jgi:hypothetical protein
MAGSIQQLADLLAEQQQVALACHALLRRLFAEHQGRRSRNVGQCGRQGQQPGYQ